MPLYFSNWPKWESRLTWQEKISRVEKARFRNWNRRWVCTLIEQHVLTKKIKKLSRKIWKSRLKVSREWSKLSSWKRKFCDWLWNKKLGYHRISWTKPMTWQIIWTSLRLSIKTLWNRQEKIVRFHNSNKWLPVCLNRCNFSQSTKIPIQKRQASRFYNPKMSPFAISLYLLPLSILIYERMTIRIRSVTVMTKLPTILVPPIKLSKT